MINMLRNLKYRYVLDMHFVSVFVSVYACVRVFVCVYAVVFFLLVS